MALKAYMVGVQVTVLATDEQEARQIVTEAIQEPVRRAAAELTYEIEYVEEDEEWDQEEEDDGQGGEGHDEEEEEQYKGPPF